ncbi:MAG: hypothetical protein KDD55_09650 [Bdellovibrionales bacterium]|nr:hypothetical protein [Bdellovibrionales bacterium]
MDANVHHNANLYSLDDISPEVEPGAGILLSRFSRERFGITYGAVTCTVVAVVIPELEAAILIHELPNIGPRVGDLLQEQLSELREKHPERSVDTLQSFFHIEIGPQTLRKRNASEIVEKNRRITQGIEEMLPHCQPLDPKMVKNMASSSDSSLSVLVDRVQGTVHVFPSDVVDSEGWTHLANRS